MANNQNEAQSPDGQFILHRFNGDERFRIESAVMWAGEEEGKVTLYFEVSADSDGAQRCEDTTGMGRAAPRVEVAIDLPDLNISRLVGQEFVMPGTQSDDEDSCMSLMSYFEHEPLRDNRITIISQSGDRLCIRWTAVTPDPCVYDGSVPPARVEIEGEFLFKNMAEWIRT
jgi:hypothetical protein